MRTPEEISPLVDNRNELLGLPGTRGPGGAALGAVASYYGDRLARLYAIASIGLAAPLETDEKALGATAAGGNER